MPKFINQSEAASFAENAARTKVVESNGTTTVYSCVPDIKDPRAADSGNWTIRRTVITEDNGATVIETAWAHGPWGNLDALTYQYL